MLKLRGNFRRRASAFRMQWNMRLILLVPAAATGLGLSFQYFLWSKRRPQPDSAIEEMKQRFEAEKGKVVTDTEVLQSYIQAKRSWHSGRLPHAVLFPSSHNDVEQMVKTCYKNSVPMTPYGHGTSLRGASVLSKPGVILNLSSMRKVKAIDVVNRSCVVEPGITVSELNERLKPEGLWLPFEDFGHMTVGGLAGTNAFSQYSDRRSFRGHVMSLQVVLPSGQSAKTRYRNDYGSAGYSLNDLFVGSEGTLGVITKLALALQPRPKDLKFAVKRNVELNSAIAEAAHLHSSGVALAEELHILPNGNADLYLSHTGTEPTGFAPARREDMHQMPHPYSTFASLGVPVSTLLRTLEDARKTLDREQLSYSLRAVPARGEVIVEVQNLHDDGHLRKQIKSVLTLLSNRAILSEGTCAVNYGIGTELSHVLETDIGANSVSLQRKLKTTIDPYFLMNPGKLFDGSVAPDSFGEMLLWKMKQFWLE